MKDAPAQLTQDRISACDHARRWLEQLPLASAESEAQRQFGLTLCEAIHAGTTECIPSNDGSMRLPSPAALVGMHRTELLEFARRVSLSVPIQMVAKHSRMKQYEKILGGLALSYACTGNLSVVAALIRSAARLGLKHPWLAEAEGYMLDQQRSDGGFGLIASEVALLRTEASHMLLSLRLTVEVLWALAEANCQDVAKTW